MTRALTLLFATCLTALAQTNYTEAMYRSALDTESTSPLYVLITLHEDKTNTARLVCVAAPFLLGAIQIEHHLDYNKAGQQKALALATAQPDRIFSFTDSKARSNIQPRYSPEILVQVRQLLAAMSDAQLRDEVRTFDTPLQKRMFAESVAYRDAVAHVCLERGILVGRADMSGLLYLAQ